MELYIYLYCQLGLFGRIECFIVYNILVNIAFSNLCNVTMLQTSLHSHDTSEWQ